MQPSQFSDLPEYLQPGDSLVLNNTEVLPQEAQPIVAIASDQVISPADYHCDGPLLALDDIQGIADFVLSYCGLKQSP